MFELVKRNGRHEEYDGVKLAQSLWQAGVSRFLLPKVVARAGLWPNPTTDVLRAHVESELKRWHPDAARRYAQPRRLHTFGSDNIARGSVRLYPETVARLGAKSGDTVWLRPYGIPVPFVAETTAQVEPGQVWLNRADLVRMEINPGVKLLTTGVWPAPVNLAGSHVPPERHDRLVAASV